MTFHVDTSIIVAEGCAGEAVDQSQQISGQVTTYEADGYHEVTLGHFCFEQNVEDPDVTFFFEDTDGEPSQITDERIAMLERVGFEWT